MTSDPAPDLRIPDTADTADSPGPGPGTWTAAEMGDQATSSSAARVGASILP